MGSDVGLWRVSLGGQGGVLGAPSCAAWTPQTLSREQLTMWIESTMWEGAAQHLESCLEGLARPSAQQLPTGGCLSRSGGGEGVEPPSDSSC